MLCLEQIAGEEAAVEASPLQVANSTMSSSPPDVDARPDRQEQDDVQRALDLSMEGITQAGLEALPAQLYGSPSSSNGSVWSDLPATSFDKELQQALNNSLRGVGPVKPLVGPLKPISSLVGAFPDSSRLNKNLAPLVGMFPRFRQIRGMQLAHLATSELSLTQGAPPPPPPPPTISP